jgi:AcrR family transcriptional regulator
MISRRAVLPLDVLPSSPHKLRDMSEVGGADGGDAGLSRLPPGRHGLPREVVVENQRRRIAAGMIAVVVERGYNAATVTQVVTAAGVSRRSFYNYYADKAEAFFDVYAQVTDFLCEAMAEAGESERGWPAKVGARIETLLGYLVENPDLISFCFVAPPAAGREVIARYRAFLERLLEILKDGRPQRTKRPSPAAEYGLVGGMVALIVGALGEGDAAAIPRLGPELSVLVLTPYLGREAATRAAH